MTPKQILLMRHAEKPDDPRDPHLSDEGRARAEKLAAYVPTDLGKPDFLFASAPSGHSVRPIETVTPLSNKIGVPIDFTIADQDYPALAQELLTDPKFEGKLVLICWHHGHIPDLAFALGASGVNVPNPWDPSVFNLILNFAYSDGPPPGVTQITEPF
jgi:broad specificity phosphatase PhoE